MAHTNTKPVISVEMATLKRAMSGLAKECELIDAALAYGAAQEKYSAEYDRRPPESVKRDGFTDVLFDEAQNAAVGALHKARTRMEKLAEELYAASREESLKSAGGAR